MQDRTNAGRHRLSPAAIGLLVLLALALAYITWFARHAPPDARAISAVELSFTPGNFSEAVAAWVARPDGSRRTWTVDAQLLSQFRWRAIGSDFFFITVYVTLLLLAYRTAERSGGAEPLWLPQLAVVAAGALDVVENVGILTLTRSLTAGEQLLPSLFAARTVRAMSTVSAGKWAALALALAFLGRALFRGERRVVLVLCRYSIVSILLGTTPLIATAQGRDLLAALAETGGRAHRLFFLASLAVWGLSVWYWSRVLLDAQHSPDPGRPYRGLPRQLPRLLGAVTMLAPAAPLFFADVPGRSKVALVGGCVALTVLFVLFVRARRAWLNARNANTAISFYTSALVETAPFKLAVASLVISFAAFVAFVWASVPTGRLLGAIPILFVAAANTVFFGSLAVFFTRRYRLSIEVFAFVCAAAFSFWNDNHDVYLASRTQPQPLDAVFRSWAADMKRRPHRATEPDNRAVFLIAAEGGGIRAAYWTATVLGALHDAAPDEFPYHVFSVNGISGGSLGAAVYARLRHDGVRAEARATATSVLAEGYLAPILARLVTGDFLQWFLPLPIHGFDRSKALEDGFADSYKRTTHVDGLRTPFLDTVPSAITGVPVLILAGTHVESGGRILTASFSWDHGEFPDAVDYHRETHGDPTLVVAVHNSARFAYVSPAGLVRDDQLTAKGHVIDGGYFDPAGLETLFDLQSALTPIAVEEDVHLVPIFITNSFRSLGVQLGERAGQPTATAQGTLKSQPPTVPPTELVGRPVEILGELFAPVRGLLRGRNAHARAIENRQESSFGLITFAFQAPDSSGKPSETVKRLEPPLGWELSSATRQRIDAFWRTCENDGSPAPALAAVLQELGEPAPTCRMRSPGQ